MCFSHIDTLFIKFRVSILRGSSTLMDGSSSLGEVFFFFFFFFWGGGILLTNFNHFYYYFMNSLRSGTGATPDK